MASFCTELGAGLLVAVVKTAGKDGQSVIIGVVHKWIVRMAFSIELSNQLNAYSREACSLARRYLQVYGATDGPRLECNAPRLRPYRVAASSNSARTQSRTSRVAGRAAVRGL